MTDRAAGDYAAGTSTVSGTTLKLGIPGKACYDTGANITITDPNFDGNNIKAGVSILGKAGTMTNRTTGDYAADGLTSTNNIIKLSVPGDAFYGNAANITYTDNNWVSSNIKAGASILGKAGSSTVVDTVTGTAVSTDIKKDKIAFVNGLPVTGNMSDRPIGDYATDSFTSSNNTLKLSVPGDAFYGGDVNITYTDNNWVEGNIKLGVNILGKVGTGPKYSVGDFISGSSLQAPPIAKYTIAGDTNISLTVSVQDNTSLFVAEGKNGYKIRKYNYSDMQLAWETTISTFPYKMAEYGDSVYIGTSSNSYGAVIRISKATGQILATKQLSLGPQVEFISANENGVCCTVPYTAPGAEYLYSLPLDLSTANQLFSLYSVVGIHCPRGYDRVIYCLKNSSGTYLINSAKQSTGETEFTSVSIGYTANEVFRDENPSYPYFYITNYQSPRIISFYQYSAANPVGGGTPIQPPSNILGGYSPDMQHIGFCNGWYCCKANSNSEDTYDSQSGLLWRDSTIEYWNPGTHYKLPSGNIMALWINSLATISVNMYKIVS
jgi:hypothetical protein